MKHENLETATPSGVPGGEMTGPVAAVSTREDLIERLKELSQEICLTYWIGAIDDAIVALETNSEPKCSDHPDAPHGFCRDASHSVGRYVCECEGWIPEPAVPQVLQEPEGFVSKEEIEYLRAGGSSATFYPINSDLASDPDFTPLYAAPQLQRPLLTDDEIAEWTDTVIRKEAFNRPIAIEIAKQAARWAEKKVRGEE
jgi:hypothetical protein